MTGPCFDCPRACGADRSRAAGLCGAPAAPRVARAALHFGEEPCLSGTRGAGAVFFSGCSLRCIYCQNAVISRECRGKTIDEVRLLEIFKELAAAGAHNLDLVTPTHFLPAILPALEQPLGVPIVMNTGGYERVETLRSIEGRIDVYLPDLKYCDEQLGRRFSGAPDYFEHAARALKEMARQYGVTYPTVRLRLDRLIQKIQIGEQEGADPYISLVKRLAVNDRLDFDTAKLLIQEYKKAKQKEAD